MNFISACYSEISALSMYIVKSIYPKFNLEKSYGVGVSGAEEFSVRRCVDIKELPAKDAICAFEHVIVRLSAV